MHSVALFLLDSQTPESLIIKSESNPDLDRCAVFSRLARAGSLLTGFRQLPRSSGARPPAQLRGQAQLFPLLFLTVNVNVSTCLCHLQPLMCQLQRPQAA